MPPEPHLCSQGVAMEMIHNSLKEIFSKLESISVKTEGIAVQNNELKHINGDISEIKIASKATEERLTTTENTVKTLTTEVAALTGTKVGVQQRINGFGWEILRYAAIALFILVVENFPKISKYMGIASTSTK